MTIEESLNKPYWVIDILPKQVPAKCGGQYFRIEKYYLEHPHIDNIYRKFTNILLKLKCYEDIDVGHDSEEWVTNPAPHEHVRNKEIKEREQIRTVMRWVGPRMILYTPIDVLDIF